MMLYGKQLIDHAYDVALACNEDVRTALACAIFSTLDAEQHAAESVARPKEAFLTMATLSVLDVVLPRNAVDVEITSLFGDISMS
eukprot:6636251-Lingulodinium_polyedra.AAC.1